MPLDKPTLITGLETLYDDMLTRSISSKSEWASRMANLIDAFVKSGDVQAGIPVSTTGSATAQTGATTGSGKMV